MKVDIKNSKFPVITDICWVADGYVGNQEIANIYLGGRQVKRKATVKLKARFDTDVETADFVATWKKELDNGVKTFIIDAMLFGTQDMYGIQQISPFVHVNTKAGNYVTFTAKVLFDSASIDNHVPVVENMTVHLEENSKDNFIILKGHDQDKELIDFQVGVGTAFGTLVGTPPNLLYTPDPSFQGIDCFNYTGSDYWGKSKDGVVTIIVDDSLKPDSIFTYAVNNPVRMIGNIHYDLGDGIWHRSNGGLLVPIAHRIKIASLDHRVDTRDEQHILAIEVNKWGSRTDYEDFASDMRHLTAFTVDASAGTCVAQSMKRMFANTPKLISVPTFQTAKVEDFSEAFMGSAVAYIPEFNFAAARTVARMCKDSSVQYLGKMVTPRCNDFSAMLMDTPKFLCLTGIDTTGAATTHDMFLRCNAAGKPSSADRVTIMAGTVFTQAGGCGFHLDKLVQTTIATCHTAKLSQHCTAKGVYDVVTVAQAGVTMTYKWTTSWGTIKKGATAKQVEIDYVVNAVQFNTATVTCVVTDSNGKVQSANMTVNVNHTSDELQLTLPKSYGRINLKDYISAHNPKGLDNIIISNKVVNCAIDTGDLTGLTVTLINYSEIQGFRDGNKDAFTATSPITLDNRGIIRGAGKTGDRGANGADDKYNKITYTEKYTKAHCGTGGKNDSNWHDIAGDPAGLHAIIHWQGKRQEVWTSKTDGIAVAGESGTFRRGKYQTKITCNYPNTVYGIIHETTTLATRKGGIGGLGGLGQGYGKKPTKGQNGGASKPTGGNSGKRGADGGLWGTGGNAIKGKAKLTAASKTGTVQGAVV